MSGDQPVGGPGGWPAHVVDRWRSSLRLRVSTTTVLVGVVGLVLLGAVVSLTIRDGLFEARRDEILADAAAHTRSAQQTFDGAIANTGPQVQQLASDVVGRSRGGGGGVVGAMLLRSPSETAQVLINEPVLDERLLDKSVLTNEMRQAVDDGGLHWQSIALPAALGGGPGIIVGSQVTLPVVGNYELYTVYTLAPEEDTLRLVTQVLGAGAVTLLIFLGGMTWFFAQRVLRPVREVARTAERLADGMLDERLDVHGTDELATLGRSFNEMAESLQDQIERMAELSHLQQRFVSDVSHELRTPLTTIRMASEVLHANRDSFAPAVRRSAELLQTQIDRFEQMLADLLEISRFDAGAAALDVERRDLQDIVAHAVELAAPLAERTGSHISVTGPGRPCDADIDPRRVERIVRNLIVNAIEHGEGRPIEITVGVNESAVAVVVRDHGAGMTPEEAGRVFDRFWRGDPARARTSGGTGLGLSISLEDARLHAGTLDAWGSPGEGAAFRLTLPRSAGMVISSSPLPLPARGPAAEPAEDGGDVAPRADLESAGGR